MAVSMVVSLVMVVFDIAHCRNLHSISPHGATDAGALISSSAFDQESSSED